MERMIRLNRSQNKVFNSNKIGELPEPYMDLKEEVHEFFVDFEVMPTVSEWQGTRTRQPKGMIYLIGMGWICPVTKNWKFRSFVAPSLSIGSEYSVLYEWYETIKEVRKQAGAKRAILYHWSAAEPRFLNKALTRHSLRRLSNDLQDDSCEWRDLMEMFMEAEVVVRGVWGYSVKDVAKGLHKHGLLPEVWKPGEKGGDPVLQSGEGTVGTASGCYRNAKRDGIDVGRTAEFDSLRTYNEMDCRVMYDLLYFLRQNIYAVNEHYVFENPFVSISPTAVWTSPSQTRGMPSPHSLDDGFTLGKVRKQRKRKRVAPYPTSEEERSSIADRVKRRRQDDQNYETKGG
jgi:hypothetical protein